ncbi:hypothetical protein N1851_021955 [Merluccius polli]|uniref:PTPRJ transmembrane domain-containing protein n=1 Tax=Merluccius polli TaxID=89951 RepID=A0AA47MJ79_MERPO|nr:hypothetical protein N1851_021955 [Merluccius polli]
MTSSQHAHGLCVDSGLRLSPRPENNGIRCLFYVHSYLGVHPSNLSQYLNETYQRWSSGSTSTYLATLRADGLRSTASDLTVVIGDGGSWEGYTNGELTANQQYRYGRAFKVTV